MSPANNLSLADKPLEELQRIEQLNKDILATRQRELQAFGLGQGNPKDGALVIKKINFTLKRIAKFQAAIARKELAINGIPLEVREPEKAIPAQRVEGQPPVISKIREHSSSKEKRSSGKTERRKTSSRKTEKSESRKPHRSRVRKNKDEISLLNSGTAAIPKIILRKLDSPVSTKWRIPLLSGKTLPTNPAISGVGTPCVEP